MTTIGINEHFIMHYDIDPSKSDDLAHALRLDQFHYSVSIHGDDNRFNIVVSPFSCSRAYAICKTFD